MTKLTKSQGTWVQTERKAHEAWDLLIKKHSAAARVMHRLVSLMDKKGAVVISQKTLGELLGLHRNSVGRAVKTLESDNWIEVIKLGAESGGVRGYRVNRRVAWADKRSNQRFAEFDARVIVSASEQGRDVDQSLPDLRHIPISHHPSLRLLSQTCLPSKATHTCKNNLKSIEGNKTTMNETDISTHQCPRCKNYFSDDKYDHLTGLCFSCFGEAEDRALDAGTDHELPAHQP